MQPTWTKISPLCSLQLHVQPHAVVECEKSCDAGASQALEKTVFKICMNVLWFISQCPSLPTSVDVLNVHTSPIL